MTIKDWCDACTKNNAIYYEQDGICHCYASNTKLFFTDDMFWVDFGIASLPVKYFYKTEKECALSYIETIKKQYGV